MPAAADLKVKNMPEMMKSGLVSTLQMFCQVGKKPKSTQLSVPIPSPSSAAWRSR